MFAKVSLWAEATIWANKILADAWLPEYSHVTQSNTRKYAPPADVGLDNILNAINVPADLTVNICTPTGQTMNCLIPLNVTLLKQGIQYIESFLRWVPG
jgi:hypothetical protein